MSIKSTYVAGARGARSGLRSVGALPVLDRWAARSRVGLWSRSLLSIHDAEELAALDTPWWTLDAAARVDAFLAGRRQARALEWGSGASTVWLARRCASVVAIEHDAPWAEVVRGLVPEGSSVDLRLVEAPPATGAAGEVRSAKPGWTDRDFRAYVDMVNQVGGTFDVIVIDGRARQACLVAALPHLADDGILVFDNVDRRRYRDALAAIGPRIEVTTTRGLTPGLPYPTRTAIVRHHRPG